MCKKIIYAACLLWATIFCACQKGKIATLPEIQIDMPGTSGGSAVFSLAATKSSCLSAAVAGRYYKGVPLNDSNTILVNVHIDTIGTYTIATANINGILFKTSGIFTSAGNQTICLKGTGTPLNTGTRTYIPGEDGCSFPVTVAANGSISNDAIYALAGAPDSCEASAICGEYRKNIALNKADSIVLKFTVGKPGLYSISTNAVNGMLFSANGIFTSTGTTRVTLLGFGTPSAQGYYNFIPGTNGCYFTILVK